MNVGMRDGGGGGRRQHQVWEQVVPTLPWWWWWGMAISRILSTFGLELNWMRGRGKGWTHLFSIDHDMSQDHIMYLSATLTRISLRLCSDCTLVSLQQHTQSVVTMSFWYFIPILMVCDTISLWGDQANWFLWLQVVLWWHIILHCTTKCEWLLTFIFCAL